MIRIAFAFVLAAALSGCSLLPMGGAGDLDTTTTGSITPSATTKPSAPAASPATAPERSIVDALDPSDWETIRSAVSNGILKSGDGRPLDWSNPDTGSEGTLTPVASVRNERGGQECRRFALTVNDLRGVRRYRGDACRTATGMWQLFDVTPEDRALL